MNVALGRATDDDGSPPYWPWRQVLKALGIESTVTLEGAASSRERFALFQDVDDALAQAGEAVGLLVVLDDLQWADAATIALLTHVSTAVASSRLAVIVTYRDTETTGQEAVRAAVARLVGESSVTRVRLGGLSEVEVAEHIAAITGWPVPTSVAAAVAHRTQGNPFFVGELGRRLAASTDDRLPEGIRDAVRDRLNRLSPDCRLLVCAAAVLGSDVDPVVLSDAADRPLSVVLAALDEAVAAGILSSDNGLRFAHDLIRDAARLEVSTADRLRLHRRAAERLTDRGDRDMLVTEIAFHWLESLPDGDPVAAVAWACRAGDQAMTQLAWEQAARLYQRALDASVKHGVLAPVQRCTLWLDLAEAQVRAFDLESSERSLVAAVGIARAADDVDALARAALMLEGINDLNWDSTARALAEEALARLPTVDSPIRARLLALLAFTGAASDQADARSAEALAMAERLGDRTALREALRARQMVRSGPDGVRDRLDLGQRLVELGAERDDDATMWGRLWRFDALAQLGDLDGADAEIGRLEAIAVRLRSPLVDWHVARCRAAMAAARGQYEQALRFGRAAEAAAARTGTESAHVPSKGLILLVRQQIGTLDRAAIELALLPRTGPVTDFVRSVYAGYLVNVGERDEAYRVYRSLRWRDQAPFVQLSAYAFMVELADEFGDRDTAATIYGLLQPHADLFVCSGAGVIMIVGPVRLPLGIAAAATGRLDDAVRHLRLAIDLSTGAGMPGVAAAAQYRLARVLARRKRPGDRDEAAALATSAASVAGPLDLRPLEDSARQLADSLAGRGQKPLTRREQEVAGLVAQGLSNRQIAAAAHISERTAESHVQHILVKLGLGNRTQIAAWAQTRNVGTGPP
jgi:DNA-binding NarL/FixJ family response regulator